MKNTNDIDLNKIIEEYNNLNEYQKKKILDPNITYNQNETQLQIIKGQLYKNNQDNISEMFTGIAVLMNFTAISLGVILPIALAEAGIISAGLATGLGIPLALFLAIGVPILIDYIADTKNDNSYVSNLVRDIYSKNLGFTIHATLVFTGFPFMTAALLTAQQGSTLSLFIFAASGPASLIVGIAAVALIYKYYSNKNEPIHLGKMQDKTGGSIMLSSGGGDIGMEKRIGKGNEDEKVNEKKPDKM
jgi:hypothetical protein